MRRTAGAQGRGCEPSQRRRHPGLSRGRQRRRLRRAGAARHGPDPAHHRSVRRGAAVGRGLPEPDRSPGSGGLGHRRRRRLDRDVLAASQGRRLRHHGLDVGPPGRGHPGRAPPRAAGRRPRLVRGHGRRHGSRHRGGGDPRRRDTGPIRRRPWPSGRDFRGDHQPGRHPPEAAPLQSRPGRRPVDDARRLRGGGRAAEASGSGRARPRSVHRSGSRRPGAGRRRHSGGGSARLAVGTGPRRRSRPARGRGRRW